MHESKVVKMIDGQDEILRLKFINDLKVKHDEECHKLRAEHAENEKRLMRELEAQHLQEIHEIRQDQQAKSQALLMALLKTKSERDRIFLTVSGIAVAIITLLIFKGLDQGIIARIFMFIALASFIGAVMSIKENLMINDRHFKFLKEGISIPGLLLEKEAQKASRFMIFGLISALILAVNLFINIPRESSESPQKPQLADPKTVVPAVEQPIKETNSPSKSIPTPEIAPTAPVAAAASSSETTSMVKTVGNGGNFTGGSSK